MKNNERCGIDCRIREGVRVLKEDIGENEKFLFLNERLKEFYQNKVGCYFGIANRKFRKDVYRKLADLLNEVSYVSSKNEQDCLLDNVYLWYMRKVGVWVNGEIELDRKKGVEKCGKSFKGYDNVESKVGEKKKIGFSTLRTFEVKYRIPKLFSDIMGNGKTRKNWASFSPEPESCWKLIGNNNFSSYNRGRSFENREIKNEQKKFLITEPNSNKPSKNLRISGDLILKLNTVQESAKKCFHYSRRIFRKK